MKIISVANQKVKSTVNKCDAKSYAKQETALKDVNTVGRITCGGLECRIV